MRISTTGLIASIQLTTYVFILAYAAVVALLIGHWPSYNNPDPKTLPTGLLTMATAFLLFASLVSIPAYPLALLIKGTKDCIKKWHFWVFICGLILWTLDFKFFHVMNPREKGLLSWLLD